MGNTPTAIPTGLDYPQCRTLSELDTARPLRATNRDVRYKRGRTAETQTTSSGSLSLLPLPLERWSSLSFLWLWKKRDHLLGVPILSHPEPEAKKSRGLKSLNVSLTLPRLNGFGSGFGCRRQHPNESEEVAAAVHNETNDSSERGRRHDDEQHYISDSTLCVSHHRLHHGNHYVCG